MVLPQPSTPSKAISLPFRAEINLMFSLDPAFSFKRVDANSEEFSGNIMASGSQRHTAQYGKKCVALRIEVKEWLWRSLANCIKPPGRGWVL